MTHYHGPKNRFPGDLLIQVRRDPLNFFQEMTQRYPQVCRVPVAPRECLYILSEPDLIGAMLTGDHRKFEKGAALKRSRTLLGEGLLTAEGSAHLERRRLVQPCFHRAQVAGHGHAMVECTLAAAEQFGDEVDLHREMMALTLKVVTRTLMNCELEQDTEVVHQALEEALGQFKILLLPFFKVLQYLPIPRVRRFRAAQAALEDVVDKLIEEHRADPSKGGLIAVLKHLKEKEIRDEVLIMLLAGHETTANALTFTFYLLSQHPQARARVLEELAEVCGEREVTGEDYPRLRYTRHVLNESLRLYPPAYAVGRRSLEDFPALGGHIPAGAILIAPQYSMHRDPRFFEDPLDFRPERWQDHQGPKYAYFPFGGGTRICIGEGFARLEAVLVLATLLRRFEFEALEAPVLEAGITLRPRDGLPVKVRRARSLPTVVTLR